MSKPPKQHWFAWNLLPPPSPWYNDALSAAGVYLNDDVISSLKAIFIPYLGPNRMSLWPSCYADDSNRYWAKGIIIYICLCINIFTAWFSVRELLNLWCDTWTCSVDCPSDLILFQTEPTENRLKTSRYHNIHLIAFSQRIMLLKQFYKCSIRVAFKSQ